MERIAHEIWSMPRRLAPGFARGLLAVSLGFLALAGLGLSFDDLLLRFLYVSAIGAIALANLTLSLGSLLPEERGGRALRGVSRFFVLAMFLTLPAALVIAIV